MIKIKEIKEIKESIIDEVIVLLDSEIKESIFSYLNLKLKKEFLKNFIKKDTLYLYACFEEDELVGCALLGNKPSEYFNQLKDLKFTILINLIIRLKLKALLNIFLAYFHLDILHLDSQIKDKIDDNLNLNLIVIKNSFQSKGIGQLFFTKIIDNFKQMDKKIISLEADNSRSISFYEKKMNFKIVGKKIRFFKFQTILTKDL
tara:strand:+ start:1169 stop:1777 length:609 start_codon:yes stop_codon:yes gene_type:complete